ncbi:voltage-dependent calcium channel subunit alpha-2/delta-1-like isoform X3 [Apostichopus japonicus]|uniref:voltage-dependent calcium channel subunit alpha-2/delta-1-like isoform X3 n=1 Tax=Stichopus japonicus TaxID=307972 RepID=UPI003AB87186
MTIDRRKCRMLCVFIFICLNTIPVNIMCQEDLLPSVSLLESWSQNISNHLIDLLDTSTHFQELKQNYETSSYTTEEINGGTLLEEVASAWEEMLELKMEAVKNIVENLEESSKHYEYDPNIEPKNVTFKNSKNFTDDIVVEYNELFRSLVNTSFSSIQIPTDIFEEDPDILNSIRATDSVDEVFIKNAQRDDKLIWQYFGSATGFYRSYPATEEGGTTLLPYNRQWYIQATSSPKNVMILIDTSGSTYGMTLEVIKVSVSKALDTLGNDDYVMVAEFNQEATIVGCFETFVQANLRNKQLLKDHVQNLNASGQVSFDNALSFAFKHFEDFKVTEDKDAKDNNNQGANCIRAIMIFTDGGREMARETLEERNKDENGNRWVRIFVYNVGTDSMVPSDGVKSMACENDGFFSNIRSFGAVRLTTLDYVPVLSRPMVLSDEKNFQWSDIYLDALGLGMMTTLTQPVYSKTKNGSLTEELLGVVGTDITTKNMAETVPQRKPSYNAIFNRPIGPEGYAFGINRNGYILLHPRLKAEFGGLGDVENQTLGYLSDPPNVDFLEVEFEDDQKIQLRKQMIDGKTGSETFSTFVMSSDERYVEEVDMTYSFTFINKTTFSVALAQPFFDLVQFAPIITGTEQRRANTALSPEHQKEHVVLIAPWSFCESLKAETNDTSQVYQAIDDPDVNSCDMEAINKLWGDALTTSDWVENITRNEAYNGSSPLGIRSIFVATQGGLSRFAPESSLDTEEAQRAKQDPWEQNYYRRPLYKPDTYIFSVPYNDGQGLNNESVLDITASKAIHINRKWSPAVVGAILNAQTFEEFWLPKTMQGENGLDGAYCFQNTSAQHCYLLDDGGFIISTSAEDVKSDVGRFFGEVDGRVMQSLVNNNVYAKHTSFDFQAACPFIAETASPGIRSAFVPSFSYLANLWWWMFSAMWNMVTHTMYDLIVFGITEPSIVTAQTAAEGKNVSCIMTQTQYAFGESAVNMTGIETCSHRNSPKECDRRWFSAQVSKTNLLLLFVNPRCPTSECAKITVRQVPQEASAQETNPCFVTPRYRRRPPENCYDYNPNESSICSKGVSVTIPRSFTVTLLLLGLASRYLSY